MIWEVFYFNQSSFERIGELSRGGQGFVVEGRRGGNAVVRKYLIGSIESDPDAFQRFEREIHIIDDMSHPYIMELTAHGVESPGGGQGSVPYYEMPKAEFDLGRWSEASRSWSRESRNAALLGFMWQAVCALAYCHQRGVVHRDLKPGNILIHENLVRIADFGYGKREAESIPITRSMDAFGTRFYMPPEQSLDFPVGRKTLDVYSLAATFFHVFTGRMPAANVSVDGGEMDAIPPALRPFFAKCMKYNPDSRPADGLECRELLYDVCSRPGSGAQLPILIDPHSSFEAHVASLGIGDGNAARYVEQSYDSCSRNGYPDVYKYFSAAVVSAGLGGAYREGVVNVVFRYDRDVFLKSPSWVNISEVGNLYASFLYYLRKVPDSRFTLFRTISYVEALERLGRSYLSRVLHFTDFDGGRTFLSMFCSRYDLEVGEEEARVFRQLLNENRAAAEFVAKEVRYERLGVPEIIDRELVAYR